jgi:hypothetical protein
LKILGKDQVSKNAKNKLKSGDEEIFEKIMIRYS